MNISELSPELQELCHIRQKEQGNDGTFDEDIGCGKNEGNFNWDETPEGDGFWSRVHDGEDMTEDVLYPKFTYQIF